ncbi:MAG: hypothetical protein ACLP22_18780, partial [Solirubrobacteraceae bacterium]
SFIGPDSVAAGRAAAAAAEQDKLWNFVDLMYLNQGEENTGYVWSAKGPHTGRQSEAFSRRRSRHQHQ